MRLARFEPEYIAWEIERADLAAAVVERIVGPHAAGSDLVEIFGRLAFAENFFVARKRGRGAGQIERLGNSRKRRRYRLASTAFARR